MTLTLFRQRAATLIMIIVAMLVLAGCAPGANLASPVGVWEATGDDNGTLTINADGTFTINDASFNLIQYRGADDNFNSSGTWRLIREESEVSLRFYEASQGDFNVGPGGIQADFRTGTMRFHDPDEIASIEFRLTESELAP